MCGFGGIFNSGFTLNRQQVQRIADRVSFRGPDNQAIRLYSEGLQPSEEGTNALFFNRLAILDLDARSNQPFEDDRYILMFNGEIYNYLELRKKLVDEGQQFHTTSDTEVLFHALRQWSVSAIGKLNGMFAFCWIDKEERRFLIARDRMGIKPLYYAAQDGSFVFASEIDSVLRMLRRPQEINPCAVQQFLWTQFIPSPNTIVKGVNKLEPGHHISGTWQGLKLRAPMESVADWDAYAMNGNGQQASVPRDLEAVLVDSLTRQMIADVPLGIFLSSGVDSSLLAGLVHKHFSRSQQFNFFTVAFAEETVSDESREAIEYIRGFNNPALVNHTLTVDASLIGKRLDSLYDFLDEPFGDQTTLLNWAISQKAKEFVTVVLSGDGADELFWGYPRYEHWKHAALQMPFGISLQGRLASLVRPMLPGKYWSAKAELELEPDPLHRHFTLFLSPVLRQLTKEPIWQQPIWAMQGAEGLATQEDAVAWWDLKTYLADAMLHKVDRASMAASLEVRVPYLDNKVVDYALALPWKEKSNGQYKFKSALKQLLSQLAPHYPMNRPKKGFNFPLDKWLRLGWRERVLSLVNQDALRSLGLDDRIYLPMVKRYYDGDKRYCIVVWYLLNLALWNQKFKRIEPLA